MKRLVIMYTTANLLWESRYVNSCIHFKKRNCEPQKSKQYSMFSGYLVVCHKVSEYPQFDLLKDELTRRNRQS